MGLVSKKTALSNFINGTAHVGRGVFQKDAAEHIKCIFICKKEFFNGKQESRRYLIGFLTDSNKFSIVNFNDRIKTDVEFQQAGAVCLRKFLKMFGTKNIDKNTFVVIDGDELNPLEFLPTAIGAMRNFVGFDLRTVTTTTIVKTIDNVYDCLTPNNPGQKKKRQKSYKKNLPFQFKMRWINVCHEFAKKNKICPWITDETIGSTTLERYPGKRRAGKIVELGLLAAMIMKYNKIKNKRA